MYDIIKLNDINWTKWILDLHLLSIKSNYVTSKLIILHDIDIIEFASNDGTLFYQNALTRNVDCKEFGLSYGVQQLLNHECNKNLWTKL